MNKKREIYSDVLKIVSIFLVIVIHVIAIFRDKYFIDGGKQYFVLTFIDSFTRIAVPIFFMITGTFMLPRKTEKYSSYLKKRIPKLLIPLFIASIFFYFFECNKFGVSPGILDFVTSFFNNSIKYHLWYMYAIILIYLLIPYLQILVQNLDRKKLLSLIILIIIFSNGFNTIYLLTNRYDVGILKAFVLPEIFSFINYCFMGYYFSKYKVEENKKVLFLILSAVCIVLMPIADHFFIKDYRYDAMLAATSIFPIIPSIFVYIFTKDFFAKRKVSDIFSNISSKVSSCIVYIYLIHPYILEKFEKDLYKYWTPHRFVGNAMRIVIDTVVVFIVSVLISYLIVTIQGLVTKLIRKKQEKK